MKIGLVGTGPWGRKLADKFRSVGLEISVYSRKGGDSVEGLGVRVNWEDMLFGKNKVEAIVVAAPPEVSLKIAIHAVNAGVPILATKPLMLDRQLSLRAPFFVDYVGLWSPKWKAFKDRAALEPVTVEFYGKGPVRDFPGLLDYGSHALALVRDLLGRYQALSITNVRTERGLVYVEGDINGVSVDILTGNGAEFSRRRVIMGAQIYEDDKSEDALGILVRDFIEHVKAGHSDRSLLELTSVIAKDLRTIQAACALGL